MPATKIATWKVIQKHLGFRVLGFKVLGFRVPTWEPIHTHFQLTITISNCEQKKMIFLKWTTQHPPTWYVWCQFTMHHRRMWKGLIWSRVQKHPRLIISSIGAKPRTPTRELQEAPRWGWLHTLLSMSVGHRPYAYQGRYFQQPKWVRCNQHFHGTSSKIVAVLHLSWDEIGEQEPVPPKKPCKEKGKKSEPQMNTYNMCTFTWTHTWMSFLQYKFFYVEGIFF